MLVERATAIKMDLTANIARVKHALGSLEQEHHSLMHILSAYNHQPPKDQ